MSTKKNRGKTVELRVSGHQVSLSFAPKQNLTVAQQICASLIDSYIRRHGNTERAGQ